MRTELPNNRDIEVVKNTRLDIKVIDKYVAGICLSGNEIKSVRMRNVSMKGSYVICKNLEINIVELFIKKYKNSNFSLLNNNERRKRKLLLKKSEIKKISKLTKEKGYILTPLKMFISQGKWAKVEIAVSQKKKDYQIKNEQKEKDLKRKIERKDIFS